MHHDEGTWPGCSATIAPRCSAADRPRERARSARSFAAPRRQQAMRAPRRESGIPLQIRVGVHPPGQGAARTTRRVRRARPRRAAHDCGGARTGPWRDWLGAKPNSGVSGRRWPWSTRRNDLKESHDMPLLAVSGCVSPAGGVPCLPNQEEQVVSAGQARANLGARVLKAPQGSEARRTYRETCARASEVCASAG